MLANNYIRASNSITTNELRSSCKTNYSHLCTILISFLGETRVVRRVTLHATRMQQSMYTRRCPCSLEIRGQWKSLSRCYHEHFDTAITRNLYYNTLVTTKQRNREWRVLKVKICYSQRTVGIFSNEV